MSSSPAAVYAAEISHPQLRGRLTLLSAFCTALGMLFIYLLGYLIPVRLIDVSRVQRKRYWNSRLIICTDKAFLEEQHDLGSSFNPSSNSRDSEYSLFRSSFIFAKGFGNLLIFLQSALLSEFRYQNSLPHKHRMLSAAKAFFSLTWMAFHINISLSHSSLYLIFNVSTIFLSPLWRLITVWWVWYLPASRASRCWCYCQSPSLQRGLRASDGCPRLRKHCLSFEAMVGKLMRCSTLTLTGGNFPDKSDYRIEKEIKDLIENSSKSNASGKKTSKWRELRKPELYKPLTIMMTFFAFQQFSGIFVIFVYAAQVCYISS